MTIEGKKGRHSRSAQAARGREKAQRGVEKAKSLLVAVKAWGESYLVPKWKGLPKLHRLGLAILVPVTALLLLWPASTPELTAPAERVVVPLDLDSNYPAAVTENGNSDLSTAPVSAPTKISPATKTSPAIQSAVVAQSKPAAGQVADTEWNSYEIAKGDTLSNVFRDHNLPLPDLYAITKIEGKDKPLSRIQPGQLLRFKRNSDGGLDILQIEVSRQESVIYFRLSDGTFARQK